MTCSDMGGAFTGVFHPLIQVVFFFFFFFLGYREDVHSMRAARPTKIPDEPMLCEKGVQLEKMHRAST